MFAGGVQVTWTLLIETGSTAAAGGPGGSSTSMTVTRIALSVVRERSPVPLVALTTSTYSLFAASFAGLSLARSPGSSQLGACLNANAPLSSSSANRAPSTPLAIAYRCTVSSGSESAAATVPACVSFSSTLKVADAGVNMGDALPSVRPVPESDHGLVPSALVARTCTSYSVFWPRAVMVAESAGNSPSVTSVQSPGGSS